MNLNADSFVSDKFYKSMKTGTKIFSLHNLYIPILFIILGSLIGLGIYLSFIPVGDQALSRWSDISIIIISISIMIPGVILLFCLMMVIGLFMHVNQKFPPFIHNVNLKIVKTIKLVYSLLHTLPKPFILIDSLLKGIQSLMNKNIK